MMVFKKKIFFALLAVLGLLLILLLWIFSKTQSKPQEIKKVPITIIYKNVEYYEDEPTCMTLIMNDDGELCAAASMEYDKPLMVPANDDYEIGTHSLDQTTFFHLCEEPLEIIVDFKDKSIKVAEE